MRSLSRQAGWGSGRFRGGASDLPPSCPCSFLSCCCGCCWLLMLLSLTWVRRRRRGSGHTPPCSRGGRHGCGHHVDSGEVNRGGVEGAAGETELATVAGTQQHDFGTGP